MVSVRTLGVLKELRQGVSLRTEKKQLKDLWKNLKSRAKSDVAALRRSLKSTGGGENEHPDLDNVSEKVCGILPTQIKSLSNCCDEDSEFHMDVTGALFTPLEKEIIVELVGKRKHVIENKCNNGKILQEKEKAWDELVSEFNSRQGVNQRSLKQLKDLWKNLKARAKTDVASLRRSKTKTGGGEADITDLSPISEQVCGILPVQIKSIANCCDDDAEFHMDATIPDNKSTSENADENSNDSVVSTVANSDPKIISSASNTLCVVSASLGASPGKNINYTQSNCEFPVKTGVKKSASAETRETVQDVIKEEHKIKMQLLNTEHDFKMECLREERKHKAERHQLKMEILKLKKRKLVGESNNEIPDNVECGEKLNDASNSIWNPMFQ